ncbi:MAG: response regulator transcription factor [bacterium]|nr:response regulator transcription factor [bacterium]
MRQSLILVVEDEEAIRTLIGMNLEVAGYAVAEAKDGFQALQRMRETRPDLILLDWMLPGLNGIDILRKMQVDSSLSSIPVIMLTAKSEESDIVLGLEMGAIDYITKPFSNKVLVARVRAHLRRQDEPDADETSIINYKGLTLDSNQRRAILNGVELSLTFSDFELLRLFCSSPGHVYTRQQIVVRTKGSDYPVTERAVDVQIVSLRKKLGADFGVNLETVRGVGYRMRN